MIVGTNDRSVHALTFENDEIVTKHVWNVREQVVSLCGSFEHGSAMLGTDEIPIIVAGLQGGIYARISLHSGLTGVSYFGSNLTSQRELDRKLEDSEENSDNSDDDTRNTVSSLPGFGGMISYEKSKKVNQNTSLTMVGGPLHLPEPAIACGSFHGLCHLFLLSVY